MADRAEIIARLNQLSREGKLTPALQKQLQELQAGDFQPSAVGAFLRGAGQEATFGFGDEISSAVAAPFTDKTYQQHLNESRARNAMSEQAHPGSYLGGQVAGGLASVALPGGAAVRGTMGAGKIARTAAGALAGAGSEGLRAAGHAVEDERLAAVPGGAAVGAAGGALGVPLGAVVAKGVRKARDLGYSSRAALSGLGQRHNQAVAKVPPNRVVNAMTDIGGAPGAPTAAAGDQMLRRMGPDATLADVPAYQEQARAVVSAGGEGGTALSNLLRARHGAANTRTGQQFTGVSEQGQGKVIQDALAAERNIVHIPDYERILKDKQVNPSPILESMAKHVEDSGPTVKARLGRYLRQMVPDDTGTVPAEKMQNIRSELRDAINVAQREGKKNEMQNLIELKTQIDRTLDKSLPGLREARSDYAKNMATNEAVESGRDLFNTSANLPSIRGVETPEHFRNRFAQMTDTEQEAVRAGVRDQLDSMFNSGIDGPKTTRRIVLREGNKDKLRTVMGDEGAEKLIAGLETEEQFADTMKRVVEGGERKAQTTAVAKGLDLGGVEPDGPGLLKRGYRAVRGQRLSPEERTALALKRRRKLNRELGELYTLQGPRRDDIIPPLMREIERRNTPTDTFGTRALGQMLALSLGAQSQ